MDAVLPIYGRLSSRWFLCNFSLKERKINLGEWYVLMIGGKRIREIVTCCCREHFSIHNLQPAKLDARFLFLKKDDLA